MPFSSDHVTALRARAQREIDEGNLPACQFALARDGEVFVHETLGEVPSDARFTVFSASKPLLASVVWQLMGEGSLDPAVPVAEVWPEFAAHGKHVVTLEHVLLHTAGFPYAHVDLLADSAERARQMQEWTLAWEPGTRFEYHPVSAHWVLAELVRRVTGQDHRDALRSRVLDPLGLERLELGVPLERQHDVLPLQPMQSPPTKEEIFAVLGVEELELPADAQVDLYAFNDPAVRAAGVPGGGAVSDAASLALFHQALLHDPHGLWSPAVLKEVTGTIRNDLPHPLFGTASRSLGLELAGTSPGAQFRIGAGATSPGTFGHGGAAGQIAWTDPVSGLSFVFLTNGDDQHFIRAFVRGAELSHLAAACAG